MPLSHHLKHNTLLGGIAAQCRVYSDGVYESLSNPPSSNHFQVSIGLISLYILLWKRTEILIFRMDRGQARLTRKPSMALPWVTIQLFVTFPWNWSWDHAYPKTTPLHLFDVSINFDTKSPKWASLVEYRAALQTDTDRFISFHKSISLGFLVIQARYFDTNVRVIEP